MRTRYEALLPRIGTRHELTLLIGEMIGELGTSHTYLFPAEGALRRAGAVPGLLGADIVFDGAGYRRIGSCPANRTRRRATASRSSVRSPRPWLNVKEGSYLLAINGVPLLPQGRNVYDLLQDRAGRTVRLTIADDAPGRNARTLQVDALDDETGAALRRLGRGEPQHVEEPSGGTLGYVHIPDMGGHRPLRVQPAVLPADRQGGLIVDIRDNGGGFVSQMIIERLARKRVGVSAAAPWRAPSGTRSDRSLRTWP